MTGFGVGLRDLSVRFGVHAVRAGVPAAGMDAARALLPAVPYHDIWCRIGDPTVPGGHADSFATSIALHLRPYAARRERIENPQNLPVDWEDPDLDLARHSSTGSSVAWRGFGVRWTRCWAMA